MDKKGNGKICSNVRDPLGTGMVMMYGCLTPPFREEPFVWPPIQTEITVTKPDKEMKTIKEYKEEFVALFKKLQEDHGECDMVTVRNNEGEVTCSIDF